jgi:hypothetical protein
MRKIFILLTAAALGANVYAQGGFGGGRFGGPGGGGQRGGSPPEGRGNFNPDKIKETPALDSFPEIPNLTLEQRMDIGNILTDEHKAVRKLESQKHELFRKERETAEPDQTAMEKNRKKIAKIDGKIQKRIDKSNKKVAKKLSAEQYRVFLEKRQDFRFGNGRPPMTPGERGGTPNGREGMPPRGQRPGFSYQPAD